MKYRFTAVIVDDEQLARDDLKRLLTNVENIELLGEASTLQEAIAKCNDLNPDIVFLDIQLTNDSGFDLIDHLSQETKIVFVTAYDEYAIKAFEVNAYDYLLKPVTLERFNQTIEKILTGEDFKQGSGDHKLAIDDSIFLKLDSNYSFIKLSSIKYISSADDYSEVMLKENTRGKLTNKTLKEWEERLPQNQFCRIHRFTIVNIDFIENIEPWHNYSYRVYIQGESKPLLMSKRYFSIIKNKLG